MTTTKNDLFTDITPCDFTLSSDREFVTTITNTVWGLMGLVPNPGKLSFEDYSSWNNSETDFITITLPRNDVMEEDYKTSEDPYPVFENHGIQLRFPNTQPIPFIIIGFTDEIIVKRF